MKTFLILLLTALAASANAWNYVGIPYPDWAYDPCSIAPPTRPAEWPAKENGEFFYVEANHPNASDVRLSGELAAYGGMRFGCPNRPRKTLPVWSGNNNNYRAGMVIWVKGGFYNTVKTTLSSWFAQFAGTAEKPCWIYGDPSEPPTLGNVRVALFNTRHLIVDGIKWADAASQSGCVSVGDQAKDGESAFITVRNCSVEGRRYLGHSSYFSLTAPTDLNGAPDADIHDVMYYNNSFKDNGKGIDFDVVDADAHAYKFDGAWTRNRAYRVWIINNIVRSGDTPDPLDGYRKSVAGTFAQIGDQNPGSGNIDHVYIAGNDTEGMRQGCVGLKRCGHIVVSSNIVRNLLQADTAQGQAFNTKYDRQENQWFVNNYVENVDSFIIRAELTNGIANTHLPENSRVHIIGNVFKNCTRGPYDQNNASGSLGSWKTKGIALADMRGKVYIANNTVDESCYGVVTSGNSRSEPSAEVHIYNNLFTHLGNPADPLSGVGVAIFNNNGGTKYFVENNLSDNAKNRYLGIQYTTLSAWNALPWVQGNLMGDPLYVDAVADDYRLKLGSPAIDAGLKNSSIERVDVYQLFINAWADDPDFPGDPAAVWSKDFLKNARVQGSAIDIGAYESTGITPPVSSKPIKPVNVRVSPAPSE